MTGSHPDRDAALRARLAGAVLQPSPERIDRWLAAVEAAVESSEPDTEPPAPTPLPVRRPGRRRLTAGIVAAGLAAAVAATAWVGLAPLTGTQERPLTLTREQLRTNLPAGRDFGELADPATRTACLTRLGAAGLEPLAARPILLDDEPGVLLVLPTDRPGRLRVLVVSPTCTDVLADTTTG